MQQWERVVFINDCGYVQLLWPPNILDLNSFENLWALLKQKFRKHFSKKEHHSHSASKLFIALQEE